jgi:Domain of unknown function (DUF6089)
MNNNLFTMRNINILFITICTTLLPYSTYAQRMSVGFFAGAAGYQGDLTDKGYDWMELKNAIGIVATHRLTDHFAAKANFTYCKIAAMDIHSPSKKSRKFSFESPITELGLSLEWHKQSRVKYTSSGDFYNASTPYISIGVGGMRFDPFVKGLPSESPDLTAMYSKTRMMLIFGAGFKVGLGGNWTLSFDAATHMVFTDYLDGVSQSGRVNEDFYGYGGVTLYRNFGTAAKKNWTDYTKSKQKKSKKIVFKR